MNFSKYFLGSLSMAGNISRSGVPVTNISSKSFRFALLLAVGLFVCSNGMLGQSPLGTIAGTITDATGAAVTGATVTATSIQTNDTRPATTNTAGAYRIEAVRAGVHKIS